MAESHADVLAARYHLLHPLGAGGMGTLWLARDAMLHREVAVKELRIPDGMDERDRAERMARVMREAEITARLRHPAIVAVHDVLLERGKPWIVMERLRGHDLAEEIATRGQMPPQTVARLGARVLDALSTAHAHGVQHRDVKPGNVFLAGDRVVLTDFGIARAADRTALTEANAVIGSPGFIAPERLAGEPGGPAADLWSLGATLYAAVEGVRPYGGTQADIIRATLMGECRPPKAAGPLGPLLMWMMATVPGSRPDAATTRELLNQIAAGGTPRIAVPPATSPASQGQGRDAAVAFSGHAVVSRGVSGAVYGSVSGAVGESVGGPPRLRERRTDEAGSTGDLPDVTRSVRRVRIRRWVPASMITALAAATTAVIVLAPWAEDDRVAVPRPASPMFTKAVDLCSAMSATEAGKVMGTPTAPKVRRRTAGCQWTLTGTGLDLTAETDSDTPDPWSLTPASAHALLDGYRKQFTAGLREATWIWYEIGLDQKVTITRSTTRTLTDIGDEAFSFDVATSGKVQGSVVYFRLGNLVASLQYADLDARSADDVRQRAVTAAKTVADGLRKQA